MRWNIFVTMNENLFQALVAKIDFITSEKAVVEGDLHDLLAQKEELDAKISELQIEAEHSKAQLKTKADAALYELLCKHTIDSINRTRNLIEPLFYRFSKLHIGGWSDPAELDPCDR